jgi:glycosyltransferase involved in cell wall biosynthesis
MTDPTDRRLNVLYVLRAPVGGLFRHVVDLARGVAARGHRVGLIADASTGGAQAEATLATLAPELALGLSRVAMSRQIGPRDLTALAHVTRRAAEVAADVVHGHGAKGGAYARLVGARRALRVYTPHGGSLHYRWSSPTGVVYLTLERALLRRTDLFLFESAYGRDVFRAKVGDPGAAARVVHNGVTEAEFTPVAPDPQATDLVFIGELRALKGIDVLIEAMALLAQSGRPVTATIVGDGPDRAALQAQAAARGLAAQVRFVGAKPARAGFALGRLLVVPSRAESLPISCSKRPPPRLRSSPPASAGSPKSSGPMQRISSRRATPRRWPTPSARPCRTRPRCATPRCACKRVCASGSRPARWRRRCSRATPTRSPGAMVKESSDFSLSP